MDILEGISMMLKALVVIGGMIIVILLTRE